jgi:hypothetical protein
MSATARNSANAIVSGKTFTWSSLNTSVATVDAATGVVTAVSNGTAAIRATVSGESVNGSADVTVAQAVDEVSVTPPTASIQTGNSQQLSVTGTDPLGVAIATLTGSWSSSNTNIATVVPASGLVTGVSAGSAFIIFASGAARDSSEVTVTLADLNLTANTNLSGTHVFAAIDIPAGVTLTATGPLTLRATELITVAGTITGDCVAFDIEGDTAVTVTGTITNGCDAGTAAPLRLAADGELTLDGALVVSSGDITITNDPTLEDGGVSEPRLASNGPKLGAGPGVPFTHVGNSTVRYHGGGTGPDPAKAGADGITGENGDPGRNVIFRLSGNALFAGNTTLWGQDGGAGGKGQNGAGNTPSPVDLTTTGGNGGNGGTMMISVTGKITYQGSENVVRGGRGGHGGTAIAITQTNPALGPKGPSANAHAGDGGMPGLVEIRGGNGIEISSEGALIVELAAGDGAAGTATAADGANATSLLPAQEGGDATSSGGDGGDTPDLQVVQNVTGASPIFRESPVAAAASTASFEAIETAANGGGIDGGPGGVATSTGGKGGNGIQDNKNGAKGGNINASGGTGGDAKLTDALGAPLGTGGNGGNAIYMRGNGGDGSDQCPPNNVERGGDGGMGGSASGGAGLKGMGPPNGVDGSTQFELVGNGGAAGDGAGVGTRGPAGLNGVTPKGAIPDVDPTFELGAMGVDCTPPPPPGDENVLVAITFAQSSGSVPTGSHSFDVNDESMMQIGSIPVDATFPTFVANDPRRGGVGYPGGEVALNLDESFINGIPHCLAVSPDEAFVESGPSATTGQCNQFVRFKGEIINTTLGLGQAVLLEERGSGGVLATHSLQPNVLYNIELNPLTRSVAFRGSGSGSFAFDYTNLGATIRAMQMQTPANSPH